MNKPAGDVGASALEWVLMTDPKEGAFTLQIPRGWRNQPLLVRTGDAYRPVVSATSPDGGTTLFMGDPHLPSFMEPTPNLNPYSPMAQFLPPSTRIQTFIPAEPFFLHDLQQRYQQAPGFRVTSTAPNPDTEPMIRAEAQKHGINAWVTSVRISFEYQAAGATVHGLLNGLAYSIGSMWVADVSGVTTTGDPIRWNEVLTQMAQSMQTNPQWQQHQQNLHQQRMAQGQGQHQNQRAAMQVSTHNHQMRMNDIQRAGDANTQIWQERQAQNDVSHQSFMDTLSNPGTVGSYDSSNSHERFLNYIKDENTVVDQSGTSYQVDNSHERYFVNKHDNTYVGADSTTELSDLRARMGLNPDDYEEVKIKR